MDEQARVSGHAPHAAQVPSPSVWALIVAGAALLLGLALTFWSRSDRDIAAPLVGATASFALLAAAGWAWEGERSRRRADRGLHADDRCQVLSFSIAAGGLDAARAKGGLIEKLEAADDKLFPLDGFEHLRIVIAPTSDGPTQAQVETSWSAQPSAASYATARNLLLGIVNSATSIVEPDSVRVFDMEVVRDTKSAGFQLTVPAFGAVVVGILASGFLLGVVSNIFSGDGGGGSAASAPAQGSAAAPAADGPLKVTATDNKFSPTALNATAGKEVTVTLVNNGKVPHNINFLDRKGGSALASGAKSEIISGGTSETLKFTPAAAGSYYFQCDVHPDQMFGTLTVK